VTEHDDILYLTHIDEASSLIEHTAASGTRENLEGDATLRDATIFRLQTMAESTQRLSDSFKQVHPDIPWERIAGFRNRLVHGYLDVNLDVVWGIVKHDMPNLASCVRAELSRRKIEERSEPDLGLGF